MLSGYFYSHYKFQFTPLREGRRIPHVRLVEAQMISIHAPPRGATMLTSCPPTEAPISIHAPPRGATIT
mgnify:CR=1 FL=1